MSVQSLQLKKKKLITATLLALGLASLLFGVTYSLFPEHLPQPPTNKGLPVPEQFSDQIFWVIQWIGMAALVAVFSVGVFLFVSRLRVKKQNLI